MAHLHLNVVLAIHRKCESWCRTMTTDGLRRIRAGGRLLAGIFAQTLPRLPSSNPVPVRIRTKMCRR